MMQKWNDKWQAASPQLVNDLPSEQVLPSNFFSCPALGLGFEAKGPIRCTYGH